MSQKFKVTTHAVCADCRMPSKGYAEYGTADDFGNRMMSDIELASIKCFEKYGWTRGKDGNWFCSRHSHKEAA